MIENLEVRSVAVSPMEEIVRQIDVNRADLLQNYNQTLKETLFENRAQIRPGMLAGVANQEVDTLIDYFQLQAPEIATERGMQLCEMGFSEKALLRLGLISRQFLLAHLERELFPMAFITLDSYQTALVHGFIQARETTIFNEQARIRSALFTTLNRYTIQMELAAGVALAINSILNLDALLETTVELIRERFKLFYVGIFLIADDGKRLVLSAGAGTEQEKLPQNYHFQIGDNTLISQCVVDAKAKIALNLGKENSKTRSPAGARSAIVIPLMARGKTIGALAGYSQQSSAFSDRDASALGILSDQLANAIENSHLFSELQSSEKKYRTILDTIEEGYYEMDLTGHFTFTSEATCTILGYDEPETAHMHYRQFIPPEDTEKLEKAFVRVRQTGNAAQGIEHKIIKKDGVIRTVETYISLTANRAGQIAGFRGIFRDVTHRKEADQYQIERKALERSNQELEQFAYVASHDLQEPLRKIQAFGDRLQITSAGSLNADGLDCLNRMMKSASRMSVLIDDLLNLSRVKTQAQPFTPVDLTVVLKEVLSDLDGLLERTGGTVEILGDLPSIYADPLQIRQLLQNLVGNALKFHKPGEKPVIQISCILMAERRSSNKQEADHVCQISVSDNGIGFEEKYIERIFHPFQRLHTSKEYEGTGIGLSICRSIVERHHGRIAAKSTKGEGSIFLVTLPIQNKQDWEKYE